MSKVILLVDDDSAFRESVRDVLEMHGYEVIETDDGKEALPVLEKEHVDLVLTDILMPDIEGNELVGRIKKLRPDLKVIGMTGGGRIGSANEVEGMCSPFFFGKILNKPFVVDDLMAQVEKALS